MEYQEILYDTSDGVATITINRPDTLNALTSLTQAEIRHALFISDTTEEVVGTVITGSGRGFCSGVDMKSLGKISDDGKRSTLIGIQHQNENLNRDTFLGKFKPISGAFMTGNSSIYLYTGVEGEYGIGPLKILPSFSPGYYEKGDGKDLGSVLEFKREIKV